jgi:hypothetical protein
MRRALGVRLAAVAGAVLISGALTASASADVISYTCPSTGCVVTVDPGLLVGAQAGSGSGGTFAVVPTYVPLFPGLLGPLAGVGGASIGQTTQAGELSYTIIGCCGIAEQGAGATLGPDNTSANLFYYRYNLFTPGENLAAAYTSSNHVNTANGQVCAVDLGTGGCIGVFNTSGPAGTTLAQRLFVTTPYVYFGLQVVNGQPTLFTNVPLPVSP